MQYGKSVSPLTKESQWLVHIIIDLVQMAGLGETTKEFNQGFLRLVKYFHFKQCLLHFIALCPY